MYTSDPVLPGRRPRRRVAFGSAALVIALTGVLSGLVPAAAPARAAGSSRARWRQPVVRVFAEPGVGAALVRPALHAWNVSGARIRLSLTSRRRSADIVIRRPQRLPAGLTAAGCDGRGSMFWTGDRAVSGDVLWTRCQDDPSSVFLLTHEIGHTIGMDHITGSTCAVMNPIFVSGPQGVRGGNCAPPPPGRAYCGLLTAADIRQLVSLYGGRARRPQSAFCPLPSPGYPPFVSANPVAFGAATLAVTVLGDPDVSQGVAAWMQAGPDCSAAAPGATPLAFNDSPAKPGGRLEVTPPDGAGCIGVAYRGWDGTLGPVATLATTVTCSEPTPGERFCSVAVRS